MDAWAAEVRALCQSTLGLKFLTRSNSWGALADELWRYLLFSEFVFDLPVDLASRYWPMYPAPRQRRACWWKTCATGCAGMTGALRRLY